MGMDWFIAQITPGGNPYGWNNQLYTPIDAKADYSLLVWIAVGVVALLAIVVFIWGAYGFPMPASMKWAKKRRKPESEAEAFDRLCTQKLLGRREKEALRAALYRVDPSLGRQVFTDPAVFSRLMLTATDRDINALKDARLKIYGSRD